MIASKPTRLTSAVGVLTLSLLLPMISISTAVTINVRISGFAFDPQQITVARGDSVTWTNDDNVVYTLWFVDAQAQTYLLSDPIPPGGSWSYTFKEVINLEYYCLERLWINGSITVVLLHDVAVSNVTPSKTVVGQGFGLDVNVTAANIGESTETFNVTSYANTTAINQKQLTLTSGDFTTMSFTWNTTGFAKGNYTIWAYAWPVENETHTTDNNYTDGVVYVGVPGDVDANGLVNMLDLYLIALHYGTTIGQLGYVANYDVDGNGIINMLDLYIAALHYGQSDP